MLSGYEETEREILNTLKIEPLFSCNSLKNISPSSSLVYSRNSTNQREIQKSTSFYSNRFIVHKPKNRFRTAVICIISISRIK